MQYITEAEYFFEDDMFVQDSNQYFVTEALANKYGDQVECYTDTESTCKNTYCLMTVTGKFTMLSGSSATMDTKCDSCPRSEIDSEATAQKCSMKFRPTSLSLAFDPRLTQKQPEETGFFV